MASELIGEKREGSASVKKSGANKLSYVSTWHFLVGTDSSSVQREEVLFATPGLPVVGLIYGAIGAVCISKNATRRKDQVLYWDVVCEFDTAQEDQKQDPANPSDDPTTWIPIFIIDGFETKQRVLTKDKSPSPVGGKTCLNSANQPFSEPVTESLSLCSFSFVQFENPAIDLDVLLERNECVNETEFLNRDPRTLKLNVTGAELGSFGNVYAWRISYRCTYDRDTWDDKRIDMGPNALDGTELTPCLDKKKAFRIIGNLDGNGNQQDQDIDPYIISFRKYTEIEFNDFLRT